MKKLQYRYWKYETTENKFEEVNSDLFECVACRVHTNKKLRKTPSGILCMAHNNNLPRCNVDGCEKLAFEKSLCKRHYLNEYPLRTQCKSYIENVSMKHICDYKAVHGGSILCINRNTSHVNCVIEDIIKRLLDDYAYERKLELVQQAGGYKAVKALNSRRSEIETEIRKLEYKLEGLVKYEDIL
jgi:hypothetical protein